MMANYRTAGLADMAIAIHRKTGRNVVPWNLPCMWLT
jgi:hypothetical protein